MAITDLTGTTWKLNNVLTGASLQFKYRAITFENKGIIYSVFNRHYATEFGDDIDFLKFSNDNTEITVYDHGVWTNEDYKNITIISASYDTDPVLISWFESNGTLQTPSTPRKSIDLTTLPGWSSLSSGSHSITIVAKADGYRDSEPSAAVTVEKAAEIEMPLKGDLITIEDKQYRVLKTNGTVAEVLCMYDASSSLKFDTNSSYNNTYESKNIDTYCNSTFYGGLPVAMQSAIVDKTFTQDSWKWTSSVPTGSHYTGKYGSSTYYLTLVNATFGTSITRHCYCLSVQDVLDYLDATTSMGTSDTSLTDTNIWQMFWNVTTEQTYKYIWLRSAYSSRSDCAFCVIGGSGYLGYSDVYGTFAARPAFQIDLSKVEWTKDAQEDALAGTWVFNDSVTISETLDFSVSFTNDSTDYTLLSLIYALSVLGREMQYNGTAVYSGAVGWNNDAYKTITITSKLSEVENGDKLLTWLQANATKQS